MTTFLTGEDMTLLVEAEFSTDAAAHTRHHAPRFGREAWTRVVRLRRSTWRLPEAMAPACRRPHRACPTDRPACTRSR
jgi:ribosomal protein L32E